MRSNSVLEKWRNGEKTIGAWLSSDSSYAAEVMSHVGFDWLCVDQQHGVSDYASTFQMLQAISTTNTTPFVRVAWNDSATIMRALDAGAYGIVVPLVNNAEEAQKAVWACRYPPEGGRSSGPNRATLYGGNDYQANANKEIACIVMIETAEAIENLDSILSVEGVDAAYIGPSDLAYALEMTPTGDNNNPEHVKAVETIFDACIRHGVAPGIHTGSTEYTARWLAHGFQMVNLGTDMQFMRTRAADSLDQVR